MWTMIQDEGFEVRINGNKFFGFSAFFPVKMHNSEYKKGMATKKLDSGEEQQTDCRKTVTGWYHNEDLSFWGC